MSQSKSKSPLEANRKTSDLLLDSDLVSQARELKIDVSSAAEEGIKRAIKSERERLWLIENAEAIAASNAYVEKHGLPLAKYRQF
jgi:antitoxin CcdA